MALLSTTQIEPQPKECVVDPSDDAPDPDTLLAPQIMVKPTPNGVRLIYPVSMGTIPLDVFGPISSPVVPSVIELAVDPLSGTAAYAIDAHYYTELKLNIPENESFNGGVQVAVWTTGDVTITSFESGNHTPAAGNPSGVTRTPAGHLFVAEFWKVDVPGLAQGQAHPLPRPWGVELPVTTWDQLFPLSMFQAMLQEMWKGLVLQQIQDLFASQQGDPFADDDVPHLDYDSTARRATWHDPATGADIVLSPAPHVHDDFGAMDSLFFDLADAGVGLIPFVGDAADIGELVYAWQTGRDRWGRPVTNFQLSLMFLGSAMPFISSTFLRGASQFLEDLPGMLPDVVSWRLFVPSSASVEFAVDEAEAAMKQPSVLERATRSAGSHANQEATENLVKTLAEDSGLETASAAGAFARRLIDGTQDGWLTVDDVISDDGAGFTLSSLQTAYTRFLRDNPGISAVAWIEAAGG